MVRFVNKELKAHKFDSDEPISNFMDIETLVKFINLINLHLEDFGRRCGDDVKIRQCFKIQIGIDSVGQVSSNNYLFIKNIFLMIEIIIDNYLINDYLNHSKPEYCKEFVDDMNEFFIVNKIPLQIRFLDKDDFFVEKIISEEVSQEVGKTFDNFSEHQKVFNDFKDAIKKYSVSEYPESIRKSCIAIEDYLCIILDKQSCNSIDSYYKKVARKLEIPDDLNNRFENIVNYIHKNRSVDNHGRIDDVEIEDIELVNQVIIQFTMSLLNYLKIKMRKK